MRPSVERAAPSSVGSSAGIVSASRDICSSMVRDATANDSSTIGGICDSNNWLSADSSCAWSASGDRAYFLRKRDRGGGGGGRRGPRIHERQRDAEVLVDAPQLAEIRELVWTGDIADGRKQR